MVQLLTVLTLASEGEVLDDAGIPLQSWLWPDYVVQHLGEVWEQNHDSMPGLQMSPEFVRELIARRGAEYVAILASCECEDLVAVARAARYAKPIIEVVDYEGEIPAYDMKKRASEVISVQPFDSFPQRLKQTIDRLVRQ
ncbi:MAG: hypothetical protein V1735_01665 [Nanoarchaeota archaeon]